MDKNKPNMHYNEESEVLSIEMAKGESSDSNVQGPFVVDYNDNGGGRANKYNFSFDDFKKSKEALSKYASESGASMQ